MAKPNSKARAKAAAQSKAVQKPAAIDATKSGDGAVKPATTDGGNVGNSKAVINAGGVTQPDQTGTPTTAQDPIIPPSIFDQAVAFSITKPNDLNENQSARDLWETAGCEDLPPKIAVAVFDCAVHQGAKACGHLIGKIGLTQKDGEFDASALAKVAKREDEMLIDFLSWRLRRYAFTANSATNMVKWSQHILALQSFALLDLEA